MFDPRIPGAIERERAMLAHLPPAKSTTERYLRDCIAHLLDRLEVDAEFRERWVRERQVERRLHSKYGPKVGGPTESFRSATKGREN